MQQYRCHTCYGDRYGGAWPVEQFAMCGVHLEPAEKPKSDIYIDLVPLINSKAVRLLDHDRMTMQSPPELAAGALVLAYQGSSYGQRQAFKDNLKMQETYKKWAKAVA